MLHMSDCKFSFFIDIFSTLDTAVLFGAKFPVFTKQTSERPLLNHLGGKGLNVEGIWRLFCHKNLYLTLTISGGKTPEVEQM